MYASCSMYLYCKMAKSLIHGHFHFMANQSYCKCSIFIQYHRHFSYDWQISHKIKFNGNHTYAHLINVSFTFSSFRLHMIGLVFFVINISRILGDLRPVIWCWLLIPFCVNTSYYTVSHNLSILSTKIGFKSAKGNRNN
jgi:hypothetical protein